MLLPLPGSGFSISLHHNSSLSLSRITIESVQSFHTGNYTCQPANTRVGAVTHLQVVDKEWGEGYLLSASCILETLLTKVMMMMILLWWCELYKLEYLVVNN